MKRLRRTLLIPNEDESQPFGLPDIGIPAEVLFNPELTHTQKILFGFIRNLAQSEKGCWASNRYLARCLGVEKQTISNGVSVLKEYGYVTLEETKTPKGVGRIIRIDNLYQQRYELYLKEVYKNFNGIVNSLYPPIINFIPPYKKITCKVVSKEVKEKTMSDSRNLKGLLVPSDFLKFWELYPSHRRGSKGKALSSFEKICRPSYKHRPTWQRLRSAVNKQKQSEQWKADGGTYIPLAATWLNNKRWLDDPQALKRYKFKGEVDETPVKINGWIGNKFAK